MKGMGVALTYIGVMIVGILSIPFIWGIVGIRALAQWMCS